MSHRSRKPNRIVSHTVFQTQMSVKLGKQHRQAQADRNRKYKGGRYVVNKKARLTKDCRGDCWATISRVVTRLASVDRRDIKDRARPVARNSQLMAIATSGRKSLWEARLGT